VKRHRRGDDCQDRDEVVADHGALGENEALKSAGEGVTSVVEDEPEWRGVASAPCLLAVHLVEHAVEEVADGVGVAEARTNWSGEVPAVGAEEVEERSKREREAQQRDLESNLLTTFGARFSGRNSTSRRATGL